MIKQQNKQSFMTVILSAFIVFGAVLSFSAPALAVASCTFSIETPSPLIKDVNNDIKLTITNTGTDTGTQYKVYSPSSGLSFRTNTYTLWGGGYTYFGRINNVTISGNETITAGQTKQFAIGVVGYTVGTYNYTAQQTVPTVENCTTTAGTAQVYLTAPIVTPPAVTITGTPGVSQNTITWSASSGATSYDVFENTTLLANITSTSYTHTGLDNGHTYSYHVIAKNTAGDSGSSNVLNLTPASIPLTTSPDPDLSDRDIKIISMFITGFLIFMLVRGFRWRSNA